MPPNSIGTATFSVVTPAGKVTGWLTGVNCGGTTAMAISTPPVRERALHRREIDRKRARLRRSARGGGAHQSDDELIRLAG